MIIRIVKMTFRPEETENFLAHFRQHKHKIRDFEGCQHLELLRTVSNANIFFTYSYWESEKYLEKYRNSELFRSVWSHTKPLFESKAEAWSVDRVESLP